MQNSTSAPFSSPSPSPSPSSSRSSSASSLLSSWREADASLFWFLHRNASHLATLETTLSTLSFLVPGSHSEIAVEASTSFLNLLTVYRDGFPRDIKLLTRIVHQQELELEDDQEHEQHKQIQGEMGKRVVDHAIKRAFPQRSSSQYSKQQQQQQENLPTHSTPYLSSSYSSDSSSQSSLTPTPTIYLAIRATLVALRAVETLIEIILQRKYPDLFDGDGSSGNGNGNGNHTDGSGNKSGTGGSDSSGHVGGGVSAWHQRKWLILLVLEIVKAVLRCLLLIWNRGRMVVDELERITVPETSTIAVERLRSTFMQRYFGDNKIKCVCGLHRNVLKYAQPGKRTGKRLLRLSTFTALRKAAVRVDISDAREAVFDKVCDKRDTAFVRRLTRDHGEQCPLCAFYTEAKPDIQLNSSAEMTAAEQAHDDPQLFRKSLLNQLSSPTLASCFAEFLHIIRPVVHLALIKPFGWTSWIPFLNSLGCDIISITLIMNKNSSTSSSLLSSSSSSLSSWSSSSHSPHRSSSLERQERFRRFAQLLFYLARNPLFDSVVLRVLQKFIRGFLSRIPGLGSASVALVDWIVAIQRYWCYTAATS